MSRSVSMKPGGDGRSRGRILAGACDLAGPVRPFTWSFPASPAFLTDG